MLFIILIVYCSCCCVNQLEWPLLHQRHIYFSIYQVHNILHHLSVIPFTQYFSTDNRHSNPSVLDTSISTINPYQFFFNNSPFLWNKVPSYVYSTDQRPQTIPCCPQALSFLTQCCFVFICFCTALLLLYFCVVLVSCTCPFGAEHVCRPSLLCNPCLLTKIDNNNNSRQAGI